MAEMTARGEGFGKELGLGQRACAPSTAVPDLSMSVKGQEFPAYDPRGIQGMGLAYATSNRGACHLRGYTVASEVLGIPVKTDPLVTDGKPELVKAFQDATARFDSAGICVFTSFAWTLADVQPQTQAACEGDWSMEKLAERRRAHLEHGAPVQQCRRLHRQGRHLPPRLKTEPAKTGPAKGWSAASTR
jgi:aldehyde:ferredoxin oxidoreductase